MDEAKRSNRKTRTGIVISDKMQKTISVKIDRTMIHPLYGRVVRTSSKVLVHDPEEKAGIGDEVLLMETRPTSKNKRWRLVNVLKRAK